MGSKISGYFQKFRAADEIDVNRNRIIISAQSYAIASALIGGNFLVGLMLYLHANDTWLAIATMSLTVGNLMQIFAPLILERFVRKKKLLVTIRIITEICNIILIGIIPFLPFSDEQKVILMVLCISLVSITYGLVAPGYSIWHINLIPLDRRITYFSILQFVGVLITNPVTLIASKALDIFQNAGYALLGFTVLRVIAAAFCVVDCVLLIRMPENVTVSENTASKEDVSRFFHLLLHPFRDRRFLVCMFIGFLWTFLCALPGPYFLKYQLNDLHTEYSYLTLLSTLGIPLTLLFTPFWKKQIEQITWQKILFMVFFLQAIPYGLYAFLSESTPAVYPLGVFFAAACSPLSSVAISMMPFECLPEQGQSSYMAVYSTVTTAASLIATSVSAWFINITAGKEITVFGIKMINSQYWMLLVMAFLLLCSLVMFLARNQMLSYLSNDLLSKKHR